MEIVGETPAGAPVPQGGAPLTSISSSRSPLRVLTGLGGLGYSDDEACLIEANHGQGGVMEKHYPVVVHYKGGRIRKGYTRNFALYRKTFDLTEVDIQTNGEMGEVQIGLEELKALFYVKDFHGDPDYRPDGQARRQGFGDRVEVVFHDTETLIGYTYNHREADTGFVLYPADHRTNNQIVAIVRSAVRTIRMDKKHPLFTD